MNAKHTPSLTKKWQTVLIDGYTGSVSRDENRRAHGGVCLYQARRTRDGGIEARRVNSNGRAEEIGEAFAVDADTVRQWAAIEASR
jgi:hypothetical protein